jgi:putative PIN family toxin of toxin-antitoxin system
MISSMIIVDANIILSALRSRNGAAHRLLLGMLRSEVPFAVSPAVVLEYEAVIKRPGILGLRSWVSPRELDQILDAICAMAVPALPWFRIRPFLRDPDDDLYVECALAGGADTIVSNDRDFDHPMLPALGIRALSAGEYVAERGL